MKSVYTAEYQMLCAWLTRKRVEAALTQAELAQQLDKPQSFVSKYENGERRLDLIELLNITRILDCDLGEVIVEIRQWMENGR